MAEIASRYRIGCDIGGTFTDFVLLDETRGDVIIEKCLSTPRDPSDGVMTGLDHLRSRVANYIAAVSQVAHASTLVANAVIERKGARCALLCTKGFRDVLEVRRHVRVTTYELWSDPPEPLIPRYLRLPVDERTYSDGSIVKGVEPREVAAIAELLKAEQVESVAIAFLHAYKNPDNEMAAQRLLSELLPGIPISISSAVLPQIREYERTSTTVINAYIRPLVETYLSNLESRLAAAGIVAPVHVMLSNGGIASPRTACDFPIRLIESGPVAGAKVAQYYRNLAGLDDVLAFDMGGTTAKACLIHNGEIPITNELEVARSQRFTKSSGYPIAVPGAHLIEIGAGGGSIASINSLGLIQVGPESAGSEPGPACYGRGGTWPTVTDADVVLGYINPDYFAGGTMALSRERAEEAIRLGVADGAGHDLVATAWSVHDVVNEAMAGAVRMHVTERGGILERVTLIAFGGAGPVHAHHLAAKLGIRRIMVPLRAGVLSAVGLIVAPPAYDVVRTFRCNLDDLAPHLVEAAFCEMEAEIEAILRQVQPNGHVSFARAADIGYVGQGYQVTIKVDGPDGAHKDALWDKFADVYRTKYGYFYDDVPAELVTLRVNGQMHGANFKAKPSAATGRRAEDCLKPPRPAYSPRAAERREFQVYDRALLEPGMSLAGPAIVEEVSSTTFIDVGSTIEVDDHGSLVIALPEARSARRQDKQGAAAR